MLDIFDEEHIELETLVKINHSFQSPTVGGQFANNILEHVKAQPHRKTTRKILRAFACPNKEKLEDKERKH